MRKRITVVCDYDDVVAECNSEAVKRLRESGKELSYYDLNTWGDGIYLKERLEFYKDPEFVRNQPVRPEAQAFISRLIDLGCDVVFATAVPASVATIRMEQIMQHFPGVLPKNIIIGGRKDLLDVDILIDDQPDTIISSKAKWPILFRQPWNKDVTGLLSANNFDELQSIIDTIMSQNGFNQNPMKANIACLVAPSGSGKTEIIEELRKCGYQVPDIYTTSNKKRDYYKTLTRTEFESLKDDGYFIEMTSYAGDYYGIPCHVMMSAVNKGVKMVIPLDICGANALKRYYGTSVKTIYIKRTKSELVEYILKKDIPERAKMLRIVSLDSEAKNEALCDESVSAATAVEQIRNIMEG